MFPAAGPDTATALRNDADRSDDGNSYVEFATRNTPKNNELEDELNITMNYT